MSDASESMVIEPPAEEIKQAPQTEADTEAEQLSKEDKGERSASAEDPRKQEPHSRPDSGHLHHDEGQTAGEKVEEEPEKPVEEQETSHDKHQGGQEEEDQESQEMGQEGEQTAQSGEDLVHGGEGMSQEAAELPRGDLALGSGESSLRESEGGEGKGKHSPPGGDPLEDSLVYTATPRTLFEEKEEPLVKAHPLNLEWVFGINQNLPVFSLQDEGRIVILYGSSHTVVMYDYTNSTQHILQGHCSTISCLCVSEDRRWVASADKGPESLVIIWDSYSGIPVQTLFHCHPEGGVLAMAMTPDAKYVATIGADAAQRVCIWDWSSQREDPVCAAELSAAYGVQDYILFNPSDCTQLVSNSESQVVFYSWNNEKLEYTVPQVTEKSFNKVVGSFSQTVFHFRASRALTGTSLGNLVVWDRIRIPTLLKPHNKQAKKMMHVQKDSITVLTVTDSYIVTGDSKGHVKFFSDQLLLLTWYNHFNLDPVRSISFAKELPSLARGETAYPSDCTIKADKLIIRNFVISAADAVVLHVAAEATQVNTLVQEHCKPLHAVACHPAQPVICMGSYCGVLKVWDYQCKKYICSRIFEKENEINCLTYDPKGLLIGVGFTSGAVYILDALSLNNVCSEPFGYAKDTITHITFSSDSKYLATADAEFTITVFNLVSKNGEKSWQYLGRQRAHYKPIQDIMFGINLDSKMPRLLSLGMDRVLVEYDLSDSSKDDLRILASDHIEQSAVAKCMTWYPPVTKESFILTANDQFKMKLYNSTTKMCRKTLLGPTYGSPLKKIALLPVACSNELKTSYLAYITEDQVGLQILPVDGNPHKSSAVVCHPEGVSSFACSYDGKYVFTAGGGDFTVFSWETNMNALEAAACLGGKDLVPFYSLLEGGRDGELFRELEDYFYYCQLRTQGIDTMETRQVSTKIPLTETPFVMRALGFYPTEQEVEDMLNEIKFSKYVDTGKYVIDIDLADLLKLYINHRPAFGISAYELQHAFEVLGLQNENCGNALNRGELLQLLQSTGEHMTEEELAEYFSTLLGLNPEGGRSELGNYDSAGSKHLLENAIPEEITAEMFTVDILGLPTFILGPEPSEEQLTAQESE
ncbi:cilia- and flagella-associated protein 251-like isoform X1 [Acipenser ruthenus]|uniref:cilia- and flagella-associated protein 251-like isoform X1 n=1 Tax=Acipenser ruthenus TaxID=7906 RepID=UPI002740F2FB|nr:cilia- and flagella-associated protein 251-like isoform X1 [Acipenser ruthenus]XP_058889005.1 cilia- and flagella-associated protein 251-like isoform X1 [Acipenser ruthenus]